MLNHCHEFHVITQGSSCRKKTAQDLIMTVRRNDRFFPSWLNMAALDSGLTEQAHKRKKDPCFSGGTFISSPFQLVRKTVLFAVKSQLLWRYNCLLGRKWEHKKYFSMRLINHSLLVGVLYSKDKLTT